MPQNLIASLGQAISQLLSTDGSILQATGLDIFRGLATILIVWLESRLLCRQAKEGADSTSPSSPTCFS